jgi:hypothetical protein
MPSEIKPIYKDKIIRGLDRSAFLLLLAPLTFQKRDAQQHRALGISSRKQQVMAIFQSALVII